MKINKITILILMISLIFSGCEKQKNNQDQVVEEVKNDNEVASSSEKIDKNILANIPAIDTKETIKYLENGEVDASDWLTYKSDFFNMEIKYPPFLDLEEKKNNIRLLVFSNKNDKNWDMTFQETKSVYKNLSFEKKIRKASCLYSCDVKEHPLLMDYELCPVYQCDEKEVEITKTDKRYIEYTKIEITDGYSHGYSPEALMISEKMLMFGGMDTIFKKDSISRKNDAKYEKVFKEMIKSIKFLK